jgi:hypothetical protein
MTVSRKLLVSSYGERNRGGRTKAGGLKRVMFEKG